MPLFNLPSTQNLLLWHLTESAEVWMELAEKSRHPFSNPLPNRRDIERFATFLLLKEAKANELLQYNEFGKPILSNGKFISISHDKNMVGIFIHHEEIGLDIQTVEERIHRIAPKFCNEHELNQFTTTEERTAIWCTKEAIFKYFGTDVPFAESITVTSIIWEEEKIIANYSGVHGDRNFTLKLINLNNTFVVHTT